ncbi:MAG TPA: hypothetical protein PLS10_11690 [Chitinophagales bacterium]|nr:hypothetical protein [Chitinophagales bacterium]
MTVRITSKDTEETIKKKLEAHSSKKKFNAKKYVGTIKLKEDPMVIQKKLRDEWQ